MTSPKRHPPPVTRSRRALAAALALLALGAAPLAALAADAAADAALERSLLKASEKTRQKHIKELEGLSRWALSNGLTAEAKTLLETARRVDPDAAAIRRMAEAIEKAAPADAAKAEEARKAYPKKLEELNEKNARQLFAMAAGCMKAGLFTRAHDLVHQVIEADPDHKKARDILSYAWDRETKTWISKWEASMRKTSYLTEEGWVAKKDKKKWDSGQRPYLGKWIPKEEEEKIRRRNNYNPFSAETEHFEVHTNLGRKQAFEFAQLLEDYYGAFFRFYIGYYDQERGAKLLFNQAERKKKHQVKVFPSHVEYLTFVKAEKGNDKLLRESAGFYSSGDQSSFFYWMDGRSEGLDTLYHEVAHQLFDETQPNRASSKGNNWVVEGIASYMETWEKVDGKWRPGEKLSCARLQTTKAFLASNGAWKLAPFLALEHKEFHDTGRGLHYALAASFSHFLMHGEGEIYREPFIRLIKAYYEGQLTDDSVGKLIPVEGASSPGEVIEALEKQFKEYMRTLGEKPAKAAEPAEEDQES